MITLIILLLTLMVGLILFSPKAEGTKVDKLLKVSILLWVFYGAWLYSGSPLPFGLDKQPLPPYMKTTTIEEK